MCKGQTSSRGSGLLLFNTLNCCPSQLSINTKKSILYDSLGWEMLWKRRKTNGKIGRWPWKIKQTTPENTARRKERVRLENGRWNCVTIIRCGCFMLHFQAYDDTSRTILNGPLGAIFFSCSKLLMANERVFHRIKLTSTNKFWRS